MATPHLTFGTQNILLLVVRAGMTANTTSWLPCCRTGMTANTTSWLPCCRTGVTAHTTSWLPCCRTGMTANTTSRLPCCPCWDDSSVHSLHCSLGRGRHCTAASSRRTRGCLGGTRRASSPSPPCCLPCTCRPGRRPAAAGPSNRCTTCAR